jgi:hypothetical protein
MKRRQFSNEDIAEAVATGRSLAQALQRLGLNPAGGNYVLLKRNIILLGLDNSHFLGQGHLKGKSHNWTKRATLDEIYSGRVEATSTFHFKNRLLKEGVLQRPCYECQLTGWKGRPIPLELEHRDDDRKNNALENLTLLCPNCHALTTTYCGRNKGRG